VEGDSTFNWAFGEATLLLPIADPNAPLNVTIEARPFQLPQSVQPIVNGHAIGAPLPLNEGWNELTFTVPPDALAGPTARLTLDFSRTDRPLDVLPGTASLGGTGVEVPFPITIKSAGPGLSDLDPSGLAWITVSGQDASDHRSGTNVTVVDPATGQVEEVRGFDTTANEFERDQLHAFIEQIPEGKVVLVALKGPATSYLNLDTVAAFTSLGAATGPTDHGVSYALIGVKGAAEGSALEAESGSSAVDLAHLPDDRPLSSAVRAVRWDH
jgi:hypothetical protein